MKRLISLVAAMLLAGCVTAQQKAQSDFATAQVGIVNHTGKYIYSATVDGSGGGNMDAWGAGVADICCTSIPRVWYQGMKVVVQWDMPSGHTHVVKEKIVEVEKYDRPGSIYMHFFPNDEVRVIISNVYPWHPDHPIPPPVESASNSAGR